MLFPFITISFLQFSPNVRVGGGVLTIFVSPLFSFWLLTMVVPVMLLDSGEPFELLEIFLGSSSSFSLRIKGLGFLWALLPDSLFSQSKRSYKIV